MKIRNIKYSELPHVYKMLNQSFEKNNEDIFNSMMAHVLTKKGEKNVYLTYGNDNYIVVKALKKQSKKVEQNQHKGFMRLGQNS